MSTYEITLIRIVLPAVPTLEAKPRPLSEIRDKQEIHITGATTLSTTLLDARREAQAMLDETRARVERGHPEAILELLDANAAFIAVRWVRETLGKLARDGRLRRRRGRVTGRHRFSPLVVVALVNHLILMGDAANPERAFGVLEQAEILKYGTAKDLYYRGVREDRFKPVLIEFEELVRCVSDDAFRPLPGSGRGVSGGEDDQAQSLRPSARGDRDRFHSGLVGSTAMDCSIGNVASQGYAVNRGTLGYEGDLDPHAHRSPPTKPKRNVPFRSGDFGLSRRDSAPVPGE